MRRKPCPGSRSAPRRLPAGPVPGRLVIGQLRDDALETGTPFHVGNLALDTAALVKLWDGLDPVDTHFWEEENLRRYMESRAEAPMAERKKPWWKFWGTGQRVA